jgi:hypothetical protein
MSSSPETVAPLNYEAGLQMEQSFGEYIEWRVKHPAEDVTTELLSIEFC